MKSRIKIVDGFVWFLVTDKAKQLFETGLFELYVLHDDDSESLVFSSEFLDTALNVGAQIGVEAGWLPED